MHVFAHNGHLEGLRDRSEYALRTFRPLGNTVYFMPPYVITEDEIELLAARTAALVDALSSD